jgi:TonB family protein
VTIEESKVNSAPVLKPLAPKAKPTINTIDESPLLAQNETKGRGDKVGVVTDRVDGAFTKSEGNISRDTVSKGFFSYHNNTTPAPESVFKAEENAFESKRKEDSRLADNNDVSKSIQGRTSGVQITSLKKVSGRVTFSEDSTGLPGVNVVIKGTNTGTVTDMNGNYQIDLDDPDATLVYSFIGLESKEVPVENKSSVNVLMDQDVSQLSEVVVTGFGEAKEDDKIYSTFEMAEPVGGRRAFKKYLEEKLVYPRQALDNKIEGKVTIQFTVETTGKLTNFNVVKGIGYGCDDEVIRLIKQGPKWTAIKRNDEPVKGKVKVRMRFALPKKK